MKSLTIILSLLLAIICQNSTYAAFPIPDAAAELQKEVVRYLKKDLALVADFNGESVQIEFMINAKNELVIFDVTGTNEIACDYVKEMLSFRKVKFKQAKQLTKYSLRIHLPGNCPEPCFERLE